MNDTPMMTPAEIAFLERNLKRTDRVWEWGSGASTLWLAKRVRHVTAVEHSRSWAEELLARLGGSDVADVAVLFVPPNEPYQEGGLDDGDAGTFRYYVQSFSGRGIDVVIIDGRARVECARWIMECAAFGPTDKTRVFLHDCEREQYRQIWEFYFDIVERVDNLMLLTPRFDR